jgi:hypothetical protein
MKKRHTPEQIVRKLRQVDQKLALGASVPEIARELGVSVATYHRWKNQYGGMNPSEAKCLKEFHVIEGDLLPVHIETAYNIHPGPPALVSSRFDGIAIKE